MMGSELHLHLDADGQEVVSVVPITESESADIHHGMEIGFSFAPELMHLFNVETEESLF